MGQEMLLKNRFQNTFKRTNHIFSQFFNNFHHHNHYKKSKLI